MHKSSWPLVTDLEGVLSEFLVTMEAESDL